MNALVKSWKTSLGGLVAGLLLILEQVQTWLDGSADTNPDWNIIIAAMAMIWWAINSRDNDVTSSEAGAEP